MVVKLKKWPEDNNLEGSKFHVKEITDNYILLANLNDAKTEVKVK
jgi:hypothetical protein